MVSLYDMKIASLLYYLLYLVYLTFVLTLLFMTKRRRKENIIVVAEIWLCRSMLMERCSLAVPAKNSTRDGFGEGTSMLKSASNNNGEEIK